VIFIDSSFWIALLNRDDDRHDDARRLAPTLAAQRATTSNHVRGETWTFIRRRYGHRGAVAFLDRLDETPRLHVAFVDESLDREALAWLRRHDERAYSFVDATSFALMRKLGVREAFAFDGDFAAAGFVELRA
jgi:predicted nucleic acid-binding protein